MFEPIERAIRRLHTFPSATCVPLSLLGCSGEPITSEIVESITCACMQNANQTACVCCSCVGRWRHFLFDTVELLVGSPLALVSFRPITHLQISNWNAGKYVCYIYFSGYCFWMTMLTRDRSWSLVLFMLTICPLSEYTIRNLYQMLSLLWSIFRNLNNVVMPFALSVMKCLVASYLGLYNPSAFCVWI